MSQSVHPWTDDFLGCSWLARALLLPSGSLPVWPVGLTAGPCAVNLGSRTSLWESGGSGSAVWGMYSVGIAVQSPTSLSPSGGKFALGVVKAGKMATTQPGPLSSSCPILWDWCLELPGCRADPGVGGPAVQQTQRPWVKCTQTHGAGKVAPVEKFLLLPDVCLSKPRCNAGGDQPALGLAGAEPGAHPVSL